MTPRKKPPRERMTLTKIGTLIEATRADVERVAEAVGGLSSRFEDFEKRLARVEGDVDFMKPIVQSLAPLPDRVESLSKELEAVKNEVSLIRSDLSAFDKRLTTLETTS